MQNVRGGERMAVRILSLIRRPVGGTGLAILQWSHLPGGVSPSLYLNE